MMSSKLTTTTMRRRGAALEEALLDAAWQELKEVGYRNLTFDGVAARAGTSKAVLYRRWANRLELVRATLRAHRPLLSGPTPNTGRLGDDVTVILERMASGMDELRSGIGLGMLTDAMSDRKQYTFLRSQINETTLAIMKTILQKAKARGEIGDVAAMPERIITLPVDLARHELLITGEPPTEAVIEQIVHDIFLPLMAQYRKK